MVAAKLHIFIVTLVFLLLTSCASKRPTSPEPIPPPTPDPSVSQKSSEAPTPSTVPEPPKPSDDTPRITLVLGGAGVATFATVGLLKRFAEEGIIIEQIIATGWPALFALGYGFSKSVHDVEWFAMRLTDKDFYKTGIFSAGDGYASTDALSKLIDTTYKQSDFLQSKVPVVISANPTEGGDRELYSSGDWRAPLLKTMSVPGIFRPYPQEKDKEWINSQHGIDVTEAIRREAKHIVAVDMYADYLGFIKNSRKDTSDNVFRRLYLVQLKKSIDAEMKQAEVTGEIKTGSSPVDFNAKRLAIFAGYKEGARLAKAIRALR